MRRCVLILIAFGCSLAHASDDFMHIPLLVKYHQESHAAAGALVGLGLNEYLKDNMPTLKPIPRFVVCVATCLVLGYGKEHVADHHARNKEIPPWGWGCAAALTIRYVF